MDSIYTDFQTIYLLLSSLLRDRPHNGADDISRLCVGETACRAEVEIDRGASFCTQDTYLTVVFAACHDEQFRTSQAAEAHNSSKTHISSQDKA